MVSPKVTPAPDGRIRLELFLDRERDRAFFGRRIVDAVLVEDVTDDDSSLEAGFVMKPFTPMGEMDSGALFTLECTSCGNPEG